MMYVARKQMKCSLLTKIKLPSKSKIVIKKVYVLNIKTFYKKGLLLAKFKQNYIYF